MLRCSHRNSMAATVQFQWNGLSSCTIVIKHEVGEVTVITDPFLPDGSCKMPRSATADLLIATHDMEKGARDLVDGKPFVVQFPGEYEAKGVFVYGIPASPTHTIYRIECGDLNIAHLGPVIESPSAAALDRLGEVDVLLLPVGGKDVTLSAADAAELVTRLEPRVVIPVHYAVSGMETKLDSVEPFVKEAGITPERVEKIKLSKKDLPQEQTHLYILSA